MLATRIVVFAVLIVGAVGAFVALRDRGSEDAFTASQRSALGAVPPVLTPAAVEAAVRSVPEPVAAPAVATPALRASCLSHGSGQLRNPWACVISYRSGTVAHYVVQVDPDGNFSGAGTGNITGCCVRVPAIG